MANATFENRVWKKQEPASFSETSLTDTAKTTCLKWFESICERLDIASRRPSSRTRSNVVCNFC
ncbi:hypothetical protein K0M31_002157, partial [Melipona bicolor]